jgi:hypothetical protein
VRSRLTFDDIERVEFSASNAKGHSAAARTLQAWAQDEHPDDEVSPSDLLSAAAWHLGRAGDTEGSLDLYRRAVAAEGTATPDARCLLHAALLEAGQLDEARQVADDFRRARPSIADMSHMAENFEMAGDLTQAHRWVAMAVSRLEMAAESESPAEWEVEDLFKARHRLREALGFPPDDLDR